MWFVLVRVRRRKSNVSMASTACVVFTTNYSHQACRYSVVKMIPPVLPPILAACEETKSNSCLSIVLARRLPEC